MNNSSISKFAKKVNNNEMVFNSFDVKDDYIDKNVDVKEKIKNIFNSRNYIYKADVVIKLKNEVINKTIIGRNKKYLITKDNELILISDILDINYQ